MSCPFSESNHEKYPCEKLGNLPFSLKAALFENNGDLENICEDLHYHGYHKAVGTIERFSTDIRNYQYFPKKHWNKIRTTNIMERVNKEIKRRSRVIRAFPSDDSLIRLIGSILMDMNEEWITGKRYLSFDPYLVEISHEEKTEENFLQIELLGYL